MNSRYRMNTDHSCYSHLLRQPENKELLCKAASRGIRTISRQLLK